MVQSRHIVVLLFAACLSGCGGYAMPDMSASFSSPAKHADWMKGADQAPASNATDSPTTASIVAASDRTDSAARSSLFTRAFDARLADPPAPPASPAAKPAATPAAKPIALADAGDTVIPAIPPPRAGPKIVAPRGRVYLFRGVAGLLYSRGIDKLASRIRRAGFAASVGTYLLWRPTAEEAIRDYRRDPQPITLIGHSMGGDIVLDFAEMLNDAHIPVSLLVTYDPSRIADDVPPNVERYINIYQSSNFMGGGNVVQGSRFHGLYASYNLKDHTEIVHINIEKNDPIQEQLVAKVAQLAETPADTGGAAVPIRFEVPAKAAVELWDCGRAVTARAGDTLQTLATSYRVPVWALAQLNSVSEREPLAEGQRVVIPSYLEPTPMPATLTSYAPIKR